MGINSDGYADVLAQAEQLVLRQREMYMQAMRERQAKRDQWDLDEAAKIAFLKEQDASPMDVAAYDEWLVNFVAADGDLTDFVNGDFPRIRLFDVEAAETLASLAQQQGSLEEAYYGEPVIWTVDAPLDLALVPTLHLEQCLTLHLTKNAVRNITRAQVRAWGGAAVSGDNELYVDGYWANGIWVPEAYTVRAIAYVWQENVRNMRGLADEH